MEVQQTAEITVTESNDDNSIITVVAAPSGLIYRDLHPAIYTLRHVIWYAVLSLGIPGNVLSAIV